MKTDEKSKMKLLDDLPVGQQENEDEFQYKVYADILRDVFQSNRPGISVGLFGNWGQGKSTIVNLLERNPPKDTKIVVFNAWKVRGDSFRKQLILSILELLDPVEAKRYKECIGVVDIKALWAKQEFNMNSQWWQIVTNILRDCWQDKHVVRIQLVLIISVLILLGIIFVVGLKWPLFITLANAAFSAVGMTLILVAVGLLWRKYLTVIGIPEATTEGQLLRYPEQFRDVFVRQIDRFCYKQKKRLIVVIDDLDRCEPETVVQALSAIRQFADQSEVLGAEASKQPGPGCQFLIPCDELQTVLALETDGYCSNDDKKGYHDYQNELLRKFFDVVVRMDKLLPQDLVTYAESLARNGHIALNPEDAKQIVAAVNPRDPRQVKKLLNSLRLAEEKVLRYHESGLLPRPAEMPQFTQTLIALTALRETVPFVYDDICHDVDLIDRLLSGQTKSTSDREKAKRILRDAGPISPVTAKWLIACRWDRKLSGLENGCAFVFAIEDGDESRFKEILQNASPDDRSLLLDYFKTEMTNIKAPAQLRRMINLLGSYGSLGGEHEKAAFPFIEECMLSSSNQDYLSDALENLFQLDWLARQIPELQAKDHIFKIVLSNFEKEPKIRDYELHFLLQNPRLMSKVLQGSFNRTLDKMLFDINDQDWQLVIERLANSLPSDMAHCFSFAPEIALKMVSRKWCDDDSGKSKEPSKWPTPKVAKAMIGNDSKTANQCLVNLFGNSGKLSNPVRLMPDTVSIRPLWQFVAHLMSIIPSESASKFYNYFKQWLSNQVLEDEVSLVLEAMKTQMLYFTDAQIEETGRQLCEFLSQRPNATRILDYIPSRPTDDALIPKWSKLCYVFFSRFKEIAIQSAGFPDWYKQVLTKAQKDGWLVGEISDALLAYKLQTVQNVDNWLPLLQPLISESSPQTKARVLQKLKSNEHYPQVLKIGVSIVWKQTMKDEEIDEHARALADLLLNLQPPTAFKSILNEISDILNLNIAKHMLNTLVARLSRKENDFLYQREVLLAFIAKGKALLDKESGQEFKKIIKDLSAGKNEYKEFGDRIMTILNDNQADEKNK